jgi:hypothetical protein
VTWEGRGVFEASSADPDSSSPVWVDLTPYVNDVVMVPSLTTGRQNDLDQSEPSQLQMVLNNSDDRFTFGNALSPYASWWGPGGKCRYREAIAGTTMDLFVGYLEVPTEGLITAGVEQRVGISAVDQLGRLGSARPFVSTLTEHITYNGGSALRAHWALNDPSASTAGASLIAGVGPIVQVTNYNDTPTANQLLWGARQGPDGDDVAYVQYNPTQAVVASGAYSGGPRLARRDVDVPLTSGQAVAILGWIYIPFDATHPTGPGQVLVSHANDFLPPTFSLRADIGTGWQFFCDTSTGSATVTVPAIKTDAWSAFALILEVSTGNITLCVDGQVANGAIGFATSGTLQEIALDGFAGTSFAQIQMYTGSTTQITRAFFTAQYQMGWTGLERQTTGDRIRTIAQYAGISSTGLALVDKGQSVMQAAILAGQTPLEAMRDAERTEQGLLYVDGSGNLVFKDRCTLYNI